MEQAPIRILLVEDNLDDAMLLGSELEKADDAEFDVTLAGSLAEATDRIAHAGFDIVLLDLGLPDGAGVVNVKTIHDAAPDIAIVVLTGTADETLAASALQFGAQDYLIKGRSRGDELLRTIRRAIQRERVTRRAVMRMVKEFGSSASREIILPPEVDGPAGAPPSGSGARTTSVEPPPAGRPMDVSASTVEGLLQVDSATGSIDWDNWVPIGSQVGNYLITGKLGRGGMAVVYEAKNVLLDRPAAVKILPKSAATDAKSRERFLQEARAGGRVEHANTVGIYDVGETEKFFYIAMQLVRGRSAEQVLDAGGALPWQEATRIMADACRGLAAAHAAGFVHRDLKPANLLIAQDTTVKVADFGLARALEGPVPALTGAGRVVGSPPYMSPEQCRAEPVDVRTDIYSAGASYYALLTGKQPYIEAGTPMAVLSAQCNAPVPDPRNVVPSLPEACAAAVMKAMAKMREDRFQTVAELRAALDEILAGTSRLRVSAVRSVEIAAQPAATWPKFWLWFVLAGAVVAVLVVLKAVGRL
jgi:DNA-binding NarL/FixJ family response regulator